MAEPRSQAAYAVDWVAMTAEATVREPLTRERIIEAAVALADEQGIEALSMRKLGQQLGVEAMSLYNHVDGKEDILDGMLEYVFAKVDVAEADEDWKQVVRQTAVSAKNALAAHPWSVPLVTSRTAIGPATLSVMDAMIGLLVEAGFDIETTHHAWHVIAGHVMGYAFQESSSVWASKDEHDHEHAERLLREYGDVFPYVASLAPHLMHCSFDEEFSFGLDIILSGIEARRPAPR